MDDVVNFDEVFVISCEKCNGAIYWQEGPHGNLDGWWIHEVHPDNGHDAEAPEFAGDCFDD